MVCKIFYIKFVKEMEIQLNKLRQIADGNFKLPSNFEEEIKGLYSFAKNYKPTKHENILVRMFALDRLEKWAKDFNLELKSV